MSGADVDGGRPVSGADVRSDIEREFEEAKETARAYLQAVGVIGPGAISTPEYRAREKRNMRDTILRGWPPDAIVPNDLSARDATHLGCQYLHRGRDNKVLDALLDRDCSHLAYRLALEWVVCGLLATGADVPERLRRWEIERGKITGKWRPEPVQNWLIGLVVEMMVTGENVLVLYGLGDREQEQLQRDLQAVRAEVSKPFLSGKGDSEQEQLQRNLRAVRAEAGNSFLYGLGDREQEQLQRALQAVRAEAGNPFGELSNDGVLERVNKRRSRRRGNPCVRRPLTEDEMVALTQRPSTEPSGGVHMIRLTSDSRPAIRRSFPNLCWTSGESTRDKHRTYSICDAVAEVLQEELPRRGRNERNRPWVGTVRDAWWGYRNGRSQYTK